MNKLILPNEEDEEIDEEDFFLEVVASLQQDNSITMLPVTKGRMFIPTLEIQEIASTTSFHYNRNSKNMKVLLFVKFVTNHLALDCWNRLDYSYQSEKIPQALAVLALNEEDKDPNFYVGPKQQPI